MNDGDGTIVRRRSNELCKQRWFYDAIRKIVGKT